MELYRLKYSARSRICEMRCTIILRPIRGKGSRLSQARRSCLIRVSRRDETLSEKVPRFVETLEPHADNGLTRAFLTRNALRDEREMIEIAVSRV